MSRDRAMRVAMALLLLAVALPAVAVADPPSTELQPYALVQEMRAAQDSIAQQGRSALAPYRLLVEVTGKRLLDVPAAAWHTERNASAAVVFVLSGGSQVVGDAILSRPEFVDAMRPVLKASLAYVEGRSKEALAILSTLNIAAMPPTLRGNLALARAVLFSHDHPDNAMRDFALARLYAPGGVVEEVALRLQIELSRHSSAPLDLMMLLRQLLTRFPHGLHLDDAIARVVDAACSTKTAGHSAISEGLDGLLPRLASDLQLQLSMAMARQAALRALPDIAGVWVARAKVLATEGSIDRERADLYGAAVAVLSNSAGDTTAQLRRFDPSRLSNLDASLLQAVLAVDERIRAPIDSPPPLDAPARREPAEWKPSSITEADALALVKRANASLEQSSQLLEATP